MSLSVMGKSAGVSAAQLKTMIESAGRWDDNCAAALSPLQTFQYDRLQYNLTMLFGENTILLNPVMMSCKTENCPQNMVKLKQLCDLNRFHSHLMGHITDGWAAAAAPRIAKLCKEMFPTQADAKDFPMLMRACNANDQELSKFKFERNLNGKHYLTHWKDIMYSSFIIGNQHIIYQGEDALIEEILSFPSSIQNWDTWPTVKSFAMKLTSILSESEYNVYRGQRRKKRKFIPSLESRGEFVESVNHSCPGN